MGGGIEAGIEIRISEVVGDISSGEARDLGSRIGDDDGDSDNGDARSIKVGR